MQEACNTRPITSSLRAWPPLKTCGMRTLPNALQAGCPGADAYRQAAEYSGKQADGNAANWMNRPGVRERIAELKEANSRRATLSREQTIEFLCNVINTSAANVEADSPLVQSAEFVDDKPVKLKIPDKISAVRELVRICGWAQPARLELSARDTLADFIDSIRNAPRHPGMVAHAEDNGESTHTPAQETQSVVL